MNVDLCKQFMLWRHFSCLSAYPVQQSSEQPLACAPRPVAGRNVDVAATPDIDETRSPDIGEPARTRDGHVGIVAARDGDRGKGEMHERGGREIADACRQL